jgi:hypothetical protein
MYVKRMSRGGQGINLEMLSYPAQTLLRNRALVNQAGVKFISANRTSAHHTARFNSPS